MQSKTKTGLIGRAHHFLAQGVWQMDLATQPPWQRPFLRLLRFGWSVYQGFEAHVGSLHASALTYYTLLAIVPMLAVGLALARVFGGEQIARAELRDHVVGLIIAAPAVADPTGQDAHSPETAVETSDEQRMTREFSDRVLAVEDRLFQQINRISLGTLGGAGLVGLLWMVIGMLKRVEESFNMVWGIAQGRSTWRCFADYLSVVLIVPLLAVAASTVPVADMVTRHAAVAGVSAHAVQTVVGSLWAKQVIVLGFSTLAFTFLLLFMPNTRVRLVPALAGGVFTAVLFTGWLKLCTLMQVGIVKYSLIYGGFALLPILLAWVYVSWQIVMFGALIACTLQNGAVCPTARLGRQASPRSRLLLALALCAETVHAMRDRGEPFDAEAFITTRQLPARLTRALLADLTEAGLLAEVAGHPGTYLPCRDPAKLTLADVARHILDDGLSPAELGLHRLDASVVAAGHLLETELGRVLVQPVAGK
ncbi:MAG: YhjD/YihY/BrkB family envelope integrity protein [bacterium]